jgi:hypothetical protein
MNLKCLVVVLIILKNYYLEYEAFGCLNIFGFDDFIKREYLIGC